MVNIIYNAALMDNSGYAECGRNEVRALLSAGLKPILEISKHSDFRYVTPIIEECSQNKIDPSKKTIRIIRETADLYTKTSDYTIGASVWETDKLPQNWVDACNKLDELWLATKWNEEIYRKCGVTVPIYIFPHCLNIKEISLVVPNPNIRAQINNKFMFLSIFQWTPRKAWDILLTSYFNEFRGNKDVVLFIKTFKVWSEFESQEIIAEVNEFKKKFDFHPDEFPTVYILTGSLERTDILSLFKSSDAYITASRGEGWNIPAMEAMCVGLPVIATNWGAHTAFMDNSNAFLVDCETEPAHPSFMQKNYLPEQNWARPSIEHMQEQMRYVFENKSSIITGNAYSKGRKAQKDIETKFSCEVVGKMLKKRLEEISKKL